MCTHLGQQAGRWQTISASGVAGWWVSVCGLMYVCLLCYPYDAHAFKTKENPPEWACFAVHPSAVGIHMRLFSYGQVNTPEFIYECVCVRLQMSVSPAECEESYLWFSAYQDFYFLHIALCAAKTEALQGHRDAQLFIVPFNKAWISTACARRHHSHFFRKMGLASFSQNALGQRQGTVSLDFYWYRFSDLLSWW